ncbi:plasmid mobilization protein [Pseudomonas sp. UBA7530]|uniref:plasmid mobilization protein n=1 Tax=Pseudomonas sp. UBA7530 TaxID=1947341 RepID=UPI0025E31FA7|nr:hypothetical protein [Pseudomonas sp. UBA7530]
MAGKKETLSPSAPKTRQKGDDEVERIDPLEKVVSLRLTASDHAKWLAKVKASGQTRSEFFRSCVLGNKTSVVAKKPASADKLQLIFYFNKASNNINQLAWSTHQARKRGTLDAQTFGRLLEKLNSISELMAKGISDVD